MSALKKSSKSKFLSEELNDLLNDSQFINGFPKSKKHPKRKIETVEKDNFNSSEINQNVITKKKLKEDYETCGESRQKLLNIMNRHLESRKQINKKLVENFSDVISHFEADYNVLKDNEQKLEHLTSTIMKCIQQMTTAHKQNLKAFKDVYSTFKMQCEKLEVEQKAEIDKFGNELEEDIFQLKRKLISETKRIEWENIRKSLIQAIPNDF